MPNVYITTESNNVVIGQASNQAVINTADSNNVEINFNGNTIDIVAQSQSLEISKQTNNIEIGPQTSSIVIIGVGGADGEDALDETLHIKTADYTITSADDNKTYSNEGATALVTFTLESPVAGFRNGFVNLTDYGIKIQAPAGKKIKYGNVETAEGGNLITTEIGAFLQILAVNNAIFITRSPVGTWGVDA